MSACLHLRPDHTPATVPKARCPLQALSSLISHGQAEGKVISPISPPLKSCLFRFYSRNNKVGQPQRGDLGTLECPLLATREKKLSDPCLWQPGAPARAFFATLCSHSHCHRKQENHPAPSHS